MKVVLVFTGSRDSAYLPMTAVVAAAARTMEPRARPVVITDARSAGEDVHALLGDVADILPVDVPHHDATTASRWLKVRLRSIVDGDFLFLDSDALPAAPFLDAIARESPFAAVPDSTGLRPPGTCPRWVHRLYARLGWTVPATPYFNSGVMFWRDTDDARTLGRCWEAAWEDTRALGEPRDQPSLHRAIAQTGIRPEVLDATMNTFVEVHPYLVGAARVLHFFAGVPGRGRTLIDTLADARLRGEPLDWQAVERARQHRTVWEGASARDARSAIAERTIRSVWRLLHDGDLADARWAARHAVRIAPWRLETYGMVARTLIARKPAASRRPDNDI